MALTQSLTLKESLFLVLTTLVKKYMPDPDVHGRNPQKRAQAWIEITKGN